MLKYSTDGVVVTETTENEHGFLLAKEFEALKTFFPKTFLPFSAVKAKSLLEYLAVKIRYKCFDCFEDLLNNAHNSCIKDKTDIFAINNFTTETK